MKLRVFYMSFCVERYKFNTDLVCINIFIYRNGAKSKNPLNEPKIILIALSVSDYLLPLQAVKQVANNSGQVERTLMPIFCLSALKD